MPEVADMSDGLVLLGDVARKRLGMQCQYASRYVDGRHGSPNLGAGLRFEGNPADYHALRIAEGDVEEFVRRVQEHLVTVDPVQPRI